MIKDDAAIPRYNKELACYQLEKLLVDIAEAITKLMDDRDIAKANVARTIKVPVTRIDRIFKGDYNLTIKDLSDTMTALGYEINFDYKPLPEITYE